MTKQYEQQDRAIAFTFGDGNNKVIWLLASPAERAWAMAINLVVSALVFAPIGWEIYKNLKSNQSVAWAWSQIYEYTMLVVADTWTGKVGLVLFALYLALQMTLMTTSGQSIGKKIVGIKVVTGKGKETGFFHTVLLREVAYHLVCIILIGIVLNLLGLNDNFSPFHWLWLPYLASLEMLADESDNCRTLQDKFAGTTVVQTEPIIRPH